MGGIKYGARDFGKWGDIPRRLVTLAEVPFDYRRFFSENPDYLGYLANKTSDSGNDGDFQGQIPYGIQVLIRENLAMADSDSRSLQETGYLSLVEDWKYFLGA